MIDENGRAEIGAVLRFWLVEVGRQGWFVADPAVDQICAERFGRLVDQALAGGRQEWEDDREGALALLIVLDQFPRNLFRAQARAFAGDERALALAGKSIDAGYDLETALPERCFFYMPYEHSEDPRDQDRSVALFRERTKEAADYDNWILHVEKHRDLIRRFGRFPHRNAVLGRENTPEEEEHLRAGGYAPGATPKKS